jgi:hypothetical protein
MSTKRRRSLPNLEDLESEAKRHKATSSVNLFGLPPGNQGRPPWVMLIIIVNCPPILCTNMTVISKWVGTRLIFPALWIYYTLHGFITLAKLIAALLKSYIIIYFEQTQMYFCYQMLNWPPQ